MPVMSLEVGAAFSVQDDASPTLRRMSELMDALAGTARTAANAVADIGKGVSLDRLIEQAERLGRVLDGIEVSARAATGALERLASVGAESLSRAAGEAKALGSALSGSLDTAASSGAASIGRITAATREAASAASDMTARMSEGFMANQRLLSGMSGAGAAAAWVPETDPMAARMAEASGIRPWSPIVSGMSLGGNQGLDLREQKGSAAENGLVEAEAGAAGARLMNLRGLSRGMMGMAFNPLTFLGGLSVEHALKNAGEEDLAARVAEQALGITNPDSPEGEAAMIRLRAGALRASEGTIYNQRQAMSAESQFTKLTASSMGETPEKRLKNIEQIFPIVLRAAEVAENQGLGKLGENIAALTTFSHETRRYTPSQVETGTNTLLTVAETIGVSPAEVARSLKYSVPIGNLAGLDPDATTELTGFLMQSGISDTTSGTGVGQIILGMMNSGGPVASHLERQRKGQLRSELENALKLEPGSSRLGTKEAVSKHEAALEELGLMDRQTHKLVPVTQSGDLDLFRAIGVIEQYASTHPHEAVTQQLSRAFTVRGERALAPLVSPEGQEQFKNYQRYFEQQRRDLPAETRQALGAQAPIQQFQQLWTSINNTLIELVTPSLKTLGEAAKSAADSLNAIAGFLQSHKDLAEIASKGASTAAAGAGLGALFGSIFPGVGTATGAIVGAAGGFALGAGAGLLKQHPIPGLDIRNPETLWPFEPTGPTPSQGAAPAPPPKVQKQSLLMPSGGHGVTIQNVSVTVNGSTRDTTDDLVKQVHSQLAMGINRALSHASGVGNGSYSSAYQSGVDV